MSGQSGGQDDPRERTEAHLAEFFGRGEAFARQLIAENERLRRELTAAASDDEATVLPATVVEDLIARVSELEKEVAGGGRLTVDPGSVRELEDRCAGLREEATTLRGTVERLEHENYHLATLYIVVQQLLACCTLGDVIQTISEVCLNFVGVGGFSLLMVDEVRQVVFPLVREGASIDELEERPLADNGPIAAVAGLGRAWQGGDPVPHEFGVLMYLPLVSGDRMLAVLTLEAYLPQKSALSDDDFAVLAMLSENGGHALENVWVRTYANAAPMTRQAVERLLEA
ncbi:MAG: GAF domain-containing protein [Myxococcales bacterium]|nr:GAF domain-containing protein [Myxococcales bacterium]MCB9568509.1 GAF domain-containing protein [Myxococcales bacterium]MCB9702005.1 GAF domain-containing protein [Myxococcales bacterium]